MKMTTVKEWLNANVWDGEDRSGCKTDSAVFNPDELLDLVTNCIAATQPQWVSVDERLPVTGKKVIATLANSHRKRITITAMYVADRTISADDHEEGECIEYCDEADEYFLIEGWYEIVSCYDEFSYVFTGEKITHWMPLPPEPEK